MTIVGGENVPATGPFILAPTHRSNLDFVLAGAATRRRLRFMTKDSVWRSRVLGALASRLGGFPVNRGAPDRRAIDSCLAALALGDGLVLFPEGERRSGAAIGHLHDGAAYLACRAEVPIIPVGIAGSGEALPAGRVFIKPWTRIRIEVGAPLLPPSLGAGRTPRSTIGRLTAELHAQLQQLHELATVRRSAPR